MIENQYGRPGITGPATPGHADGAFLARVADQHVLLRNPTGVTGVCNTIRPMAGGPATGVAGIPTLRSLVQRDGASTWTWTDPSGLMPMWAIRMISEIVCPDPDLRVLPDPQAPGKGILYRRVLPDHTVERAPSRWAPIGPVRIAYGGSKAKDDQLDGDDGWVKDSLLLAGQTIRRGCSFVCTDGEIRFEHDPVSGAWTRTETRSGATRSWTGAKDLECREPDFRKATLREMTPNRVDEPMTYTVETGCTCEQATTLANEAGWILDQWTGHDTDSTLNLQRSLAAPFLRSHPECAYVYQGPGGTGKSTLAKDLMEHLGDQATTMSLDLLAQPTAMSAENKMGDLMSHLLALSDDYDPTHGRFEKSLPNLKTLLTGLLPFSARRQGENSVDGMPQSVHLITTNYHLPVSSSEAEQRRFAFSTIASPTTRARHYLPFRRKHGFWPFMLIGAITWLTIGDRQCRSVAFIDLESLSDMEVAAIRSVLDTGVVIPDPGMRVNWKNIGLVRTSTRIGSEDGRPHTAYRPAPEGDGLHAVWKACAAAVSGMPADEPVIRPVPDRDLKVTDPDAWADMIREADPRIFPCHADKSPSSDVPHHSWKDACQDPRVDMSHRIDPSKPIYGTTVADDYMWVDLDCHKQDQMSGWEQIQTDVGPYGTPPLPRTFAVRTPSGGVHLLYHIPDGARLKSRTHNGGQIDFKIGRDGYVVMGGSVLPDGRRYTPIDRPEDRIPDLSDAFLRWAERVDATDKPRHAPAPARTAAAPAGGATDPLAAFDLPSPGVAGNSEGEPDMSPIPEGRRNDTLYRWGYGRWKNHPEDGERIARDIMERGRISGLPERETLQIVKSVRSSVEGDR